MSDRVVVASGTTVSIRAAMKGPSMKKALIEHFKDDEVQALLAEHIKAAVAKAVAERDKEIADLKEQLRSTNLQLNELEQYSRRLCVNVSGVPEEAGESTDQIVMDLAKMTGVNLTPADIDRTHRVGKASKGGTRGIIVRFTNFLRRQDFYNARRELRKPRTVQGSTVSTETATKAYISDNLTRSNQETMYEARRLRKEGKLHSAWTDVGKMKIRLREGAPTMVIRSTEELMAAVDPERRTAAGRDRRSVADTVRQSAAPDRQSAAPGHRSADARDRPSSAAPATPAGRSAAAPAAPERRTTETTAAPATPEGTDREGFKPAQGRAKGRRGGKAPHRAQSTDSSE